MKYSSVFFVTKSYLQKFLLQFFVHFSLTELCPSKKRTTKIFLLLTSPKLASFGNLFSFYTYLIRWYNGNVNILFSEKINFPVKFFGICITTEVMGFT